MIKIYRFVLYSLMLIIQSAWCNSESAMFKVVSKVENAKVEISAPFEFTVTITYPEANSIKIEEAGGKILGLRVIDSLDGKKSVIDHLATITRSYKVVADLAGTYILPAVSVELLNEKGEVVTKKSTSEIFIEAKSKGDEDPKTPGDAKGKKQTDILDIKPIYQQTTILLWVFITLGGVALVVCVFLLYRYYRNQKKGKIAPQVPCEVEALEALSKLSPQTVIDQESSRLFAFTLSDIVRIYFEKRYDVMVTDMTQEEIIKRLGEIGSYESEKGRFIDLVKATDKVKFASELLDPNRAMKLLAEANDYIERTRPIVVTPNDGSEKESVI